MSLIRKHVAVLQAWACLDLVDVFSLLCGRTNRPQYGSCPSVCQSVPYGPLTQQEIWATTHETSEITGLK